MPDRLTLGIDVGTTAVKAGVLAPDGRRLAYSSDTCPIHRGPGGMAEQDPTDWTRRIESAIAQIAAEGHAPGIAAIGLCSQVNTHVFVDAAGTPLMPAILWQDGRASAEAAELDAQVTEAQKIAWWGAPMPIDASHALPRMLWTARHRPEIWARTHAVLLPKDYCLWHLTGRMTTDPLSNIGLVDSGLHWVDDLLARVPGARDRLPPLVGITEVLGEMRDGPLRGRPVVSGTMDAWAGLIGAGGAAEGASVYLSGTSEILGISSHTVIPTPGAIVFPACAGVRLHAAPTQSGGDAQAWFAAAQGLRVDQMAQMVTDTPRGAATPLFLPQLEGERAPIWDATLRGAFLGVSRATRLPDFAWAVYEGVAMAARWALETLEASSGVQSDRLTCGGGGFRADVWGQIRADVLGRPLHRLAAGEPGMLGAATLAAIGTGGFAGFDDARHAFARHDRVFTPDPDRHAAYAALFALYKDSLLATRTLNTEAARLSATVAGP